MSLTKERVYPNPHLRKTWADADYMAHYKGRCTFPDNGCWEWQGFRFRPSKNGPNCAGYAAGSYRGKNVRITRVLLGWKIGRPLTKKERACHSCDNPPCINPDHLWVGDDKTNMQDAGKKKRWPRQYNPTCINGHPRTPENVAWHGREKKLRCKVCLRERNRRDWIKKSQKKMAQRASLLNPL
jgi:hypothetical protein